MYNNGVSHITAVNDIDGIASMVKWLSYIPKHKGRMAVRLNIDYIQGDSSGCSLGSLCF